MDNILLQVIFGVTAAIILVAAILTVTVRNLIHAAMWMVLSLFGVAILFVILGTGFFAVVQVVIYIGAIAVLILFAIMLTRREMHEKVDQLNKFWWLNAVTVLILFAILILVVFNHPGALLAIPVPPDEGLVQNLGKALVEPDQFGLVFELLRYYF